MGKIALFSIITIFLFVSVSQSHSLIIKRGSNLDIIVSIEGGIERVFDNFTSLSFPNRESRLNAVYEALTRNRDLRQENILSFLDSERIWHRSLYISNEIFIPNADSDLIEKLNSFSEVMAIRPDEYILLEDPIIVQEEEEEEERQPGVLAEWGVVKINALSAWQVGTGAGAKVGVIDSGARHTHQAIASNYVGTANYGWRDPYSNSPNPIDQNGHGTHCTGTIAGNRASGIGVAPEAQWMACRGCSSSSCAQSQLLTCGQFMLCPTNPNGNNPICSRAPHIVSNSWGGGVSGTWFDPVMRSWQNAGIVGVFAQGNSGPTCRTANYPGNSPLVIGVGATTSNDGLASFSSVGPVTGTTRMKPDCSAPGQNVRSAYHTSDSIYKSLSGTSMACPHVAGTLALMYGRNPNLTVERARSILYETTQRGLPSTGRNCGTINESKYPNNAHGWGRINAYQAITKVN